MAKTNDELASELRDELRELTSRHTIGRSRYINARQRELVYLLSCYEAGEDLVYAKLAYQPDPYATLSLAVRIKRLLNCETWHVTDIAEDGTTNPDIETVCVLGDC